MSRNINNEPKAEPAELPDDTEIDGGANYEVTDPCKPQNPKPGYYYFAAADDGDVSRADGVTRCLADGYEVCTEETIQSKECKLLRMPLAKWQARDRARKARANNAARGESASLQGVPEASMWRDGEHGQMRKLGK